MFFDTRIPLMIWDIFSHCCAQLLSYVQLFATLWTIACQAPHQWDFPGKNTVASFHFLLLPVVFPTKGSNPCLLHCRGILYRWTIGEANFSHSIYKYRRRRWHPTPVLLPGKSHGWKSLVGYSPWGRKESDTTQRPHFHFSFSCIGEGNGNPLQCSYLENPRDGRAW